MITYPVNVATARFTFKLGGTTKRNQLWPRADGMPMANMDPATVILEESVGNIPAYNPTTHRLTADWVDDAVNQTAIFTYSTVALTAEEAALATKRSNLNATAIATLRDWANQARSTNVTSGNQVATLQTTLGRLATFFDRFADLLEVQRFV